MGKLAVGFAALVAAFGYVALSGQAYAVTPGAVIDISQVGANVVMTGSGVIDLAGLTFDASGPLPTNGIIWPDAAEIITGAAGSVDLYTGASGPTSMGSGAESLGNTASGDQFGVGDSTGTIIIFVPAGYDGTSLSGTATFDNTTLAMLGLSPGTYTYTWSAAVTPGVVPGDGNLTVNVSSVVPEPSTWAMMLAGFAGLGFLGYRRTAKARLAV
jgi:PEP-CTERM motif